MERKDKKSSAEVTEFKKCVKTPIVKSLNHDVSSGSLSSFIRGCMLSRFSRVQFFATHGLQPSRLLCPRDSPGKNTGVGCRALFQGSSQPRD